MRKALIAPILLSSLFFLEPDVAWASPSFLHALSETELAENSAGHGIILHLEDTARNDRLVAMTADNRVRGFLGIQTLVLDKGAASISEAATSITLRAALKGVPFQNVSPSPGF